MRRFDYCISNPPYQKINTAGSSDSKNPVIVNVFHLFQLNATEFAVKVIMIYPGARWLQRSGKGLDIFGKAMLNNPHLLQVTYYTMRESLEIFPQVRIPDGLSIVFCDAEQHMSSFNFNGQSVKHSKNEIIPVNTHIVPIVVKMNRFCEERHLSKLSESVTSRILFGIESSFVARNPDKVQLVQKGEAAPSKFTDPIKVLTNDKEGKLGRPKLFWMSRDDLPAGENMVDFWKFVVKSAQFPNETSQLKNAVILDNHTVFGRCKVALKMFKTQEEVSNFQQLMNSNLYSVLYQHSVGGGLRHLAEFLPDLKDYSNSNPLFTDDCLLPSNHEYKGLNFEQRVSVLFGLSDHEVKILENIVNGDVHNDSKV